ncbi:MAG: hypothetical protein E6Q93_27760 [Burkholderiaceae bacterium]|nr:MAG: hypothetical protein E6Q93_27760 [Burkholderiaceae bacterium]
MIPHAVARLMRAAAFAAACLPLLAAHAAEPADAAQAGARLYREGRQVDGQPLRGVRGNGVEVTGAAAACEGCHRPSGMGSVEGDVQIRPITGRYLFVEGGERHWAVMDPRVGKQLNEDRPVYTPELLVRALREGIGSDGRVLNAMMPRYALGEADAQALQAHLERLSVQWSPGVTADTIHLASVIAPGADLERRAVFVQMMEAAVRQKNMNTVGGRRVQGRRNMVSPAEHMQQTERQWTLDIWQLEGDPSTWGAQLAARQAERPAFALVSGLGTGEWGPVHAFCETQHVPCWFPSIDQPPAEPGRYALYFHRGLALEADVLAAHWTQQGPLPRRVLQLLRDEPAARAAADRLDAALKAAGAPPSRRVMLAATAAPAWARPLRQVRADETLVLWLREPDLATLADVAPPRAAAVFASGELAGIEPRALPAAWRAAVQLVYPFELPASRQANQTYFFRWLDTWQIPLRELRLQSEVYFAMTYLNDTLAEMLHNLYGEYLVERAEQMIRRREGGRAEQEARERRQLRSISAIALRRQQASQVQRGMLTEQTAMPPADSWPESTTIYPRLTLGPGQRFASKGAYIVRVDAADPARLAPVGEWIVP